MINKKNRTACKACRLRKCLMVGMSKSGSRYGRRSNWFKIHCLLQEQSHQAQTRLIKDPKSAYEKAFGSLDVANNNNNNNENPGTTNATGVVGIVTTTTTTANSYHHHHHQHHQDRFPKRDELRPQDIPAQLRAPDIPTRAAQDPLLRPMDLVRAPHELLRPEVSRFPMWRGPPFFHPALTHMQLLNTPFFPFQQRFIVPYVNQVGAPQMVASLTSSSSDSVSPRSTPSPKRDDDNRSTRDECREVGGGGCQRSQMEAYDKSIAFLRSLGPEQDEPIDLSMKAGRTDGQEVDAAGSTEEERSTDSEDNEQLLQETGPPLDLTRKTWPLVASLRTAFDRNWTGWCCWIVATIGEPASLTRWGILYCCPFTGTRRDDLWLYCAGDGLRSRRRIARNRNEGTEEKENILFAGEVEEDIVEGG